MQNIFGDIRHRGKLYMIMRLKPDEEFIYKCITSQNLELGRNGKIKIALLDEKNFWNQYLPAILKEEAGNDIDITDEKIQILKQMYQKNRSVLEKINIKILDEKYIQTFGLDSINRIALFPDIQRKLLELNDKQYKCFSEIFTYYLKHNRTLEWEEVLLVVLANIDEYGELVENIDDIENINVDELIGIMQNPNEFKIKQPEDLLKFDEIKRKKCIEWLESDDLSLMKKALYYQIFGHSDMFARKLTVQYNDIESIQNGQLRDYMKALQEIEKMKNPDEIKEIFYSCEPVTIINHLLIEADLRNEYLRQFNDQLLTIDSLQEIEHNVYDAGTEFKIIMTGLGGVSDDKTAKNYKNSWNRPQMGVSHFCASYIRNDMIGISGRPDVCYGFNKMPEGSLLGARYQGYCFRYV